MCNKYLKINDLSSLSDEQIIAKYKGIADAEDYLLTKYKGYVRSMARKYFLIGGDSDDLIQEGMIGLYKAIRDFDATKNVPFKTFAELCVMRQMITAIKAANRIKHRPLNTFVSLSYPVFEDEGEKTLEEILPNQAVMSPEEIYIENEGARVLEDVMKEALSSLENRVVGLYIEGKSYMEIAEILGKSVKSIDNAIQRAKGKLQKIDNSSEKRGSTLTK